MTEQKTPDQWEAERIERFFTIIALMICGIAWIMRQSMGK